MAGEVASEIAKEISDERFLAGIIRNEWGPYAYTNEFEEWLKNRPKKLSSEFRADGMSDKTCFYFREWYEKFDSCDKDYRFYFYLKYVKKLPEWEKKNVMEPVVNRKWARGSLQTVVHFFDNFVGKLWENM
jgi:hypothetical protein